MQFIVHRINTIKELKRIPEAYGVEIDIRSLDKKLILQHDPFRKGEEFKEWVKYYHHGTLVLNIKEEGIENAVRDILKKHHIKDYFFLDLSFPYLVKAVDSGEKKVAVRFSEYESIETALSMVGRAQWVWVDCFTKMPLGKQEYDALSRHFKICIVSPELQSRAPEQISGYKKQLGSFRIDAVCTKRIDLWIQ